MLQEFYNLENSLNACGWSSCLFLKWKFFYFFLIRTEKSSGLANKGQSRGLGSLQQTGNYALEIYFTVIKLLLLQPKGECFQFTL